VTNGPHAHIADTPTNTGSLPYGNPRDRRRGQEWHQRDAIPPATGGEPERVLSRSRPAGRTASPRGRLGRPIAVRPTVRSRRRVALCWEHSGRGLARSRVERSGIPQGRTAQRSALDRVGWLPHSVKREDATKMRHSRTTGARSGAMGLGACPHRRCRFNERQPARGTVGTVTRADRREHCGGDQGATRTARGWPGGVSGAVWWSKAEPVRRAKVAGGWRGRVVTSSPPQQQYVTSADCDAAIWE